MFKFLPYILKNLRGHRVRTVMTVLGAAVLMLLFTFVSSIREGLAKLTDPSRQDDRLIVFQAYRFCASTSQLPYPLYDDLIRKVDGVKEVIPIKVVINNCRASLDSVVFHGVPAQQLSEVRKLQFLQGDWNSFIQRRDGGAIVGRRIAERRQIEVGKPFTISGVTVNVEGIFASDQPGEENLIYTHLAFLQKQSPGGHHQDLRVTMYEVHVADPARADAVAGAIDEAIRDKHVIHTDTKPQKAYYRQALADLTELIGFTQWLGIVCVGVVGVLVANSVIMAAQDRIKEHAVLQTIGYSGGRIFRLMLGESLMISLTGGLLGVLGCLAWLTWRPLTLGSEGVAVDFLASPALAAWGLGLSTIVGVFAGLVPGLQAARADIVNSLR
jgi:putative ABC transport system permease protein